MQTLNTYNTRQPIDAHVKKRLFWVIPVYVFLKVLMPIIIVFGVYGIWAVLTQDKNTSYLSHCINIEFHCCGNCDVEMLFLLVSAEIKNNLSTFK